MEYFVTKRTNNKEYRIYLEQNSEITGKILFKGRKELLTVEVLKNIFEYRIEKMPRMFQFPNYEIFDLEQINLKEEYWFKGSDPVELIKKSWESLENKLESHKPKFKKILISENFI